MPSVHMPGESARPSRAAISALTGYSRGLYANWLWHRGLDLVIDAGEGLALSLGTQVFSPSIVAITHGHSDHVLGLPGLAGARRFGKGAPEKPWVVVYPEGSSGVEAMRTAIANVWSGVTFPVSWVPLPPGGTHAIGKNRVLEAFAVDHVPPQPAVGYRVLEQRRRLKPAHHGATPAEIEQRSRDQGRSALTDEYQHVVFAHSGDAMPIAPALVEDADVLVHDATFLAAAERRVPIHATSGEALELARVARVRALVLHHLSIRYPRDTAIPALRAQLAASGYGGECWLLDEHEFIDLR
jgi:ribonuclease Z